MYQASAWSIPFDVGKCGATFGDVNHFQSVIALSGASMSALKQHQLTSSQPSATKVRAAINDLNIEVSYPYAIDSDRMSIMMSSNHRSITIVANRRCHRFFEEQPVYIVNPDNILSLPTMLTYTEDDMDYYSAMQFSVEELATMIGINTDPLFCKSAETNIKETLSKIFHSQNEDFFQLVYNHRKQ